MSVRSLRLASDGSWFGWIEPMRYLVELFWSDEDEGYVAVVPDLSGGRRDAGGSGARDW